ncbi:hypothetical protein K2173_009986 [Erythroxylum novogranatense]|uniref:PsbP C-terminal domain-containing protein n=1 Tax=Erythroxylum novogranatense TaxID=1862640 RepID=A0AAV8T0X5_9ROSI|nr:hypothetical protein K2173_009986 [Erythroxylum novogranatense]
MKVTMASIQSSIAAYHSLAPNSVPQLGVRKIQDSFRSSRTGGAPILVRAEQSLENSGSHFQVRSGRRQLIAVTVIAPSISLINQASVSFAAETKKGYLPVMDKKDGYSFLYPFGWQVLSALISLHRVSISLSACSSASYINTIPDKFLSHLRGIEQEVVIEGQDKVFKDVIEPLESVSVNMIPTGKQDIREFGPPQEVAETLIKKVLAPPSQKTKLIEAKEVSFYTSSHSLQVLLYVFLYSQNQDCLITES